MKKFYVYGKKEVVFSTIVEAENETDALLKVNEKDRLWFEITGGGESTDGTDLQILGDPKEIK